MNRPEILNTFTDLAGYAACASAIATRSEIPEGSGAEEKSYG